MRSRHSYTIQSAGFGCKEGALKAWPRWLRLILAVLLVVGVASSAAIAAYFAVEARPLRAAACAGVAAIAALFTALAMPTLLSASERHDPRDAIHRAFAKLPSDISRAPNLLLRSAFGAAPFRGRTAEVNTLFRWCGSGVNSGLGLLIGPGGIGKSRLAAEICRRQEQAGWITGFLPLERLPRPEAISDLVHAKKPILVVVDYAETRPQQLLDLLRDLLDARRTKPWRVLLIARSAGDWWANLPNLATQVEIEAVIREATVLALGPVDETADGRLQAFLDARSCFGSILGIPIPDGELPDLLGRTFERPLFLQMAALSSLYSQESVEDPVTAGTVTDASLVRSTLEREHKFWLQTGTAVGVDTRIAERSVAVATLTRACDEDEAQAMLAAVPDLREAPEARRREIANWLCRLYPGEPDEWFRPLEPDLLGEANVAIVLGEVPSLASEVVRLCDDERAKGALTILTRVARRDEGSKLALQEAIAADVDRLWQPAMQVAEETGDPIGQVLATVIARDARPALAESVRNRVPLWSVSLLEVSAVTFGLSVESAKLEERAPSEIAHLLVNLTSAQARLGHVEAASAAALEAVELLRPLAAEQPDSYRSDLASALSSLSNCQALLGRYSEAMSSSREAADLFRAESTERPSALAQLAMALNTISMCQGHLGLHEASLASATEAVGLYRAWAPQHPERLPNLAGSISNLSIAQAAQGQRDAALASALEAVELYRAFVRHLPDLQPDLAVALNSLSRRQADLGSYGEAILSIREAIVIYRALAAARPDAFSQHLAMSIANMANYQAHAGESEDSLALSREAVTIYRAMAAKSEAHRSGLASALNNLAGAETRLGYDAEALVALGEAVSLYRVLATERSMAFKPDLADALRNLAVLLRRIGHDEDADAAVRERDGLE